MGKYFYTLIVGFLFLGCIQKQPIISQSATIVFKTPLMKFYDKGFVTQYDDYIQLQIYNAGAIVLDLKMYKDEVCRGMLQCMSNKEFNKIYLNKNYDENFMFTLFKKDKINFRDKENNILIKVRKD